MLVCDFCALLGQKVVNEIEESHLDMLHIIIPKFNPKTSFCKYLCDECQNFILNTFNFKTTCLELQDGIYKYTYENSKKINLKTITGFPIYSDVKICRTCLEVIEDDLFISLDTCDNLIKEQIETCLPEINFSLTEDSMMCSVCVKTLENYFYFIRRYDSRNNKSNEKVTQEAPTNKPICQIISVHSVENENMDATEPNMENESNIELVEKPKRSKRKKLESLSSNSADDDQDSDFIPEQDTYDSDSDSSDNSLRKRKLPKFLCSYCSHTEQTLQALKKHESTCSNRPLSYNEKVLFKEILRSRFKDKFKNISLNSIDKITTIQDALKYIKPERSPQNPPNVPQKVSILPKITDYLIKKDQKTVPIFTSFPNNSGTTLTTSNSSCFKDQNTVPVFTSSSNNSGTTLTTSNSRDDINITTLLAPVITNSNASHNLSTNSHLGVNTTTVFLNNTSNVLLNNLLVSSSGIQNNIPFTNSQIIQEVTPNLNSINKTNLGTSLIPNIPNQTISLETLLDSNTQTPTPKQTFLITDIRAINNLKTGQLHTFSKDTTVDLLIDQNKSEAPQEPNSASSDTQTLLIPNNQAVNNHESVQLGTPSVSTDDLQAEESNRPASKQCDQDLVLVTLNSATNLLIPNNETAQLSTSTVGLQNKSNKPVTSAPSDTQTVSISVENLGSVQVDMCNKKNLPGIPGKEGDNAEASKQREELVNLEAAPSDRSQAHLRSNIQTVKNVRNVPLDTDLSKKGGNHLEASKQRGEQLNLVNLEPVPFDRQTNLRSNIQTVKNVRNVPLDTDFSKKGGNHLEASKQRGEQLNLVNLEPVPFDRQTHLRSNTQTVKNVRNVPLDTDLSKKGGNNLEASKQRGEQLNLVNLEPVLFDRQTHLRSNIETVKNVRNVPLDNDLSKKGGNNLEASKQRGEQLNLVNLEPVPFDRQTHLRSNIETVKNVRNVPLDNDLSKKGGNNLEASKQRGEQLNLVNLEPVPFDRQTNLRSNIQTVKNVRNVPLDSDLSKRGGNNLEASKQRGEQSNLVNLEPVPFDRQTNLRCNIQTVENVGNVHSESDLRNLDGLKNVQLETDKKEGYNIETFNQYDEQLNLVNLNSAIFDRQTLLRPTSQTMKNLGKLQLATYRKSIQTDLRKKGGSNLEASVECGEQTVFRSNIQTANNLNLESTSTKFNTNVDSPNNQINRQQNLSMGSVPHISDSPSTSKSILGNQPIFNGSITIIDSDEDVIDENSTTEKNSDKTKELNHSLVLLNHLENHLELAIYKCNWCGFNSRFRELIEMHVFTHFDEIFLKSNFTCPHCCEMFNNKSRLYMHLEESHYVVYYKIYYWCVCCTIPFVKETFANLHYASCPKKFKIVRLFKTNSVIYCMFCMFETIRPEKANEHVKTCLMRKHIPQVYSTEEIIVLD